MVNLRAPNGVRVAVSDKVAATLGWPQWADTTAEPEHTEHVEEPAEAPKKRAPRKTKTDTEK